MTTRLPTETVIEAGRALARAGQWELGATLLRSAAGDHPHARLALAELAIWRDFWTGADQDTTAPADLDEHPEDPGQAGQAALLRLLRDYFRAIVPPGEPPRLGPDHHHPATRADLAARAAHLHATIPPGAGRGWAAFLRGLIADNINGEADQAPAWYGEALAAAEAAGDDELAAEALRHQGAHARLAGDHDRAGHLWERSTRLRQRAGNVPGALSQQLALARNAVDTGDPGRGAALAAEVKGWAQALGLPRLASGADDLLGHT